MTCWTDSCKELKAYGKPACTAPAISPTVTPPATPAATSTRGRTSSDRAEAEIHYQKAQAFLKRGETSRAIEELQHATRLAPNWKDPALALAEALEKSGKPGEAAKALRKYLPFLQGDDSNQLAQRIAELDLAEDAAAKAKTEEIRQAAEKQAAEKQAADTERQAQQKHEQDVLSAQIEIETGRRLLEGSELEGAEAAFRKAISIAPELPSAQLGLADVLEKRGRLDLAAETLRKAVPQVSKTDQPALLTRIADLELRIADALRIEKERKAREAAAAQEKAEAANRQRQQEENDRLDREQGVEITSTERTTIKLTIEGQTLSCPAPVDAGHSCVLRAPPGKATLIARAGTHQFTRAVTVPRGRVSYRIVQGSHDSGLWVLGEVGAVVLGGGIAAIGYERRSYSDLTGAAVVFVGTEITTFLLDSRKKHSGDAILEAAENAPARIRASRFQLQAGYTETGRPGQAAPSAGFAFEF